MRTRNLFRILCALTACLSAAASAAAQSDAAPTPEAGRLVVQVEPVKGAPPSYDPVPGGGWTIRFTRLRGARPRPADDAVQAVHVKARMAEGGLVEVTVGVHLGAKHFDRFEEVGKYRAAAGETFASAGLERFGVAPFVFKVLRARDAAAAPPEVVNLTQSVEAAVGEFTPTPIPRGKVTLRNLSPKRVRAVYVRQLIGGRNHAEGYISIGEGKTLMEPGGTAEERFIARTGSTSGSDFIPVAVESIVVATVLFEDYTFEGEPYPAALKRAFIEGERAQIPRLMELVREAHAAPDVESAAAVRRLREKVAALDYAAPPSAVDAVYEGHTELRPSERARWQSAVETTMHSVRREMLDALERFEARFGAAPAENSFKLWLKQRQGRYEGWLSRL
ncbi:MAG TPA: hypothetical protein VF736_05385 [Pyrinomonadaceae bacterium]|jgi:hypothetical protein